MDKLKINMKFKLRSEHKACSFCTQKNVPVVMEIRTGKAICASCIQHIAETMEVKDGNISDAAHA